jgi:hypothetical protein
VNAGGLACVFVAGVAQVVSSFRRGVVAAMTSTLPTVHERGSHSTRDHPQDALNTREGGASNRHAWGKHSGTGPLYRVQHQPNLYLQGTGASRQNSVRAFFDGMSTFGGVPSNVAGR